MYTVEQAIAAGWKDRAADFAAFMRAVDRSLLSICGLTHEDLADIDFASAFESGESPNDVAQRMLEAEGFPFGPDEPDGEWAEGWAERSAPRKKQ